MPQLSNRVNTFTDSVIRRMTRISDEYGAIDLWWNRSDDVCDDDDLQSGRQSDGIFPVL